MSTNHESKAEIKFLDGPQSRWKDFLFTLSTVTELIKGFRGLHFLGPCITVFGSARFDEHHEYYKLTQRASGEFAKLGFTIITGGGPGLMEAANRGAREVGGKSVGCNIVLPHEQKHNAYLDKWVEMKHFFIRKVLLIKYSYAFIVMPGGFGTLDEFYEALTLIQTKKIKNFPVIIFCKDFHDHLMAHTLKMREEKTISEEDLDLLLFTDSVEDAVEMIKEKCIKAYDLQPIKKEKPFKWLLEKV